MNHTVDAKKKKKKVTTQKASLDSGKDTPVKLIFLGEYFNINTFKKHIVTESFIEEQARKLIEWSKDDDALLMQEFSNTQGYRRNLFYEWVEKYEVFREAHEFALSQLGARREKGAMTRKYAEATVHRTLGHYNPIWGAETYKLSKMKEEVAQAAEQKVVIIERYPVIEGKTPEEIATAIRRTTEDNRLVGACEYDVKSRRDA